MVSSMLMMFIGMAVGFAAGIKFSEIFEIRRKSDNLYSSDTHTKGGKAS